MWIKDTLAGAAPPSGETERGERSPERWGVGGGSEAGETLSHSLEMKRKWFFFFFFFEGYGTEMTFTDRRRLAVGRTWISGRK